MSFNLPGEVNPFEAPRAEIGEEARYHDIADNDAEMIRREHIGREANIKSLGQLNYLGAFFGVIGTILYVALAAGVMPMPPNQAPGLDPNAQRIAMGIAALISLFGTLLNGALGYGLTHFQAWARWTTVAFTVLGLVVVVFYTLVVSYMISPIAGLVLLVVGGGIYGLILWLLVSKKAGVVFSSEYKEVIRKTPHVKLKTSIIVKILLVMLLLIVVFGFLAAFFSSRNG